MKKIGLFIMMLFILNGCSKDLKNSYIKSQEEFTAYKDLAQNYYMDSQWWKGYQNDDLNYLIDLALKNNKDLAKAAININKALYNANLVGADLIPTFGGSWESSVNKQRGTSVVTHASTLTINYEVDLWRKLSNATSAKQWEYQATIQDLEATKLSLINNVINTYFSLAYLNDSIAVLQGMIEYYSQIRDITQNKVRYGTGDMLNVDEAERTLLETERTLLNYEIDRKQNEQTLKNLLNIKPGENLNIYPQNILGIGYIGVDLNIPVFLIANRPDMKAYEHRLTSAFKSALSTQESLYPSISLSSSLTHKKDNVSNDFNVPITYGSIKINLPFLDWSHIKWNIKIDEASYNLAREDFEQGITTALNEIDESYYLYLQNIESYKKIEATLFYNKKISRYYKDRYDKGVSEFKDWLTALTTENNSKLTALSTKYNSISAENKIYQSLGGKAYPKNLQLKTTL